MNKSAVNPLYSRELATTMKFLTFCFTFLLCCSSWAQKDPYLDKMGMYKSKWTISDTAKLTTLNKLIRDSVYVNPKKAERYSWLSLDRAKRIESVEKQVEAMQNLYRAKIYLNDLDSAMYYVDKSLSLARLVDNPKLVIQSYEGKGNVYNYMGDFDKAINYYLKAVNFADQHSPRLAATPFNNIGLVFKNIGNPKKAWEYQRKCEKLCRKYHDSTTLSSCLNNLGILAKNDGDLDQAMKYYKEGLSIAEAIGYKKMIGNLQYNLSNVYFKLGDTKKGMELFELSLEDSKRNGSYYELSVGYYGLAFNLTDLGKLQPAFEAAEKALENAELGKNFELIVESYAVLADISNRMGKKSDAYAYLTYAYVYKDSLKLAELNDRISSAEASFNSQKKQFSDSLERAKETADRAKEKQLDEAKIRSREILLIFSVIALIVAGIGAYFLYRSKRQISAKNEIVEKQNTEIRDSINYAQRIQNALISNEDAWKKISSKQFKLFKPRDVVSGDFYWAHFNEKTQLGIWVVADCTGHGVPGAFMSMLGTSFLNEIIVDNEVTEPAKILDLLRDKIIGALRKNDQEHPKDGMDIAVCAWDKSNNSVKFSGANNPLWIIRERAQYTNSISGRILDEEDANHVLIEITPDKMPIGYSPGGHHPFRSKEVQLVSGDTLIMSTDGFADQFGGPNGKKLKSRPFKRMLLDVQKHPIVHHEEWLNHQFEKWKGQEEQVDDICIIGIRIELTM